MPIPRWVARTNRVGLNRVVSRIAPWAPGLGVVVHRGRASGRVYRTPVNVFARDDGFVIALTYGQGADWVQNVLAADGCELLTRRRLHALEEPAVYRDERRAAVPGVFRALLRALDVSEFMALRPARPRSP